MLKYEDGGTKRMISQRMTILRKRMGLTQTQLAKRLNITPSALGNYEQGRRLPGVETLVEMAEIFDVSLDYLVTGKEYGSKAESAEMIQCPCTTCYWANRNRVV